MQCKKITLAVTAVAALLSGAAAAQSSNVQIYGLIDIGFAHRGDNRLDGIGSQNAIDDGITTGSRLGFRGTEDLGNGLKALFTLEAGFATDSGNHRQGGRLFGRQASLGLTGNFGTVLAGRLYAPRYLFTGGIDPFAGGTVGAHNNVMYAGVSAPMSPADNLFFVPRVDNAVAYVSPSFSGFNVTVAYSNNAFGQENTGNQSDNRVFAILPRYTNGPLDVGVSYQHIKNENSDDVNIKTWTVGGTYDFGAVKLHAYYDENKWGDADKSALNAPGGILSGVNGNLKLKSGLLGVSVPFGKHAIQFSYTQSKLSGDKAQDGKARQVALGYTYSLSKRTSFYAAIADLSQDSKREKGSRYASSGDAMSNGSGYQNGLQFGLKHTF